MKSFVIGRQREAERLPVRARGRRICRVLRPSGSLPAFELSRGNCLQRRGAVDLPLFVRRVVQREDRETAAAKAGSRTAAAIPVIKDEQLQQGSACRASASDVRAVRTDTQWDAVP